MRIFRRRGNGDGDRIRTSASVTSRTVRQRSEGARVSVFAWVSKVPVAFEVTARLVMKLDKNCSVPAPAKVIPPAAAPRLLSARPPQACPLLSRRHVLVSDCRWRKRFGKDVAIVLRVRARTRNAAHVDQEHDLRFFKQIDEFGHRPG
jgi:hypothetical protein